MTSSSPCPPALHAGGCHRWEAHKRCVCTLCACACSVRKCGGHAQSGTQLLRWALHHLLLFQCSISCAAAHPQPPPLPCRLNSPTIPSVLIRAPPSTINQMLGASSPFLRKRP